MVERDSGYQLDIFSGLHGAGLRNREFDYVVYVSPELAGRDRDIDVFTESVQTGSGYHYAPGIDEGNGNALFRKGRRGSLECSEIIPR